MPSSTSSSNDWSAKRAIGTLLLALAIGGLLLEPLSIFLMQRVSKIESRVWREYRAARTLAPIGQNGKPSMLVAGNSLLLEGVDVASLQTMLADHWSVTRYVIEQTAYLDWKFGLQRLFDEGARPAQVVLFLNTRHLVSDATRGEHFAQLQMRLRDLPEVARRSHLTTTEASTYAFANLSNWFGGRSEIRKVLLLRLLPGTEGLLLLFDPATPLPPDSVMEAQVAPRLKELKEICSTYGAHLTIVIPPTLDGEDRAEGVIAAGRDTGVKVLKPSQGQEPSKELYRDGFHLTPAGAAIFTRMLAPALLSSVTP